MHRKTDEISAITKKNKIKINITTALYFKDQSVTS